MTTSSDLQKFCRCCLSMPTEVNNLIEMKDSIGRITILDMFLESSGVAVQTLLKTIDDAPKICKVCVELLKSAYYFRVLCRTADKALQESAGKMTPVPTNSKSIAQPKPWIKVAKFANSIQENKPTPKEKKPPTGADVIQLSSDESDNETDHPRPHKNPQTTKLNHEVDIVKVMKKSARPEHTGPIPNFNRLSMKEDEQNLFKREVDKMVAEFYPAEVTHQCPYCKNMFEQIEHLIQHISDLH